MVLKSVIIFFAIKRVSSVAMPAVISAPGNSVKKKCGVGWMSVFMVAMTPLRAFWIVVSVINDTIKSAVPMPPMSVK